MFWLYSPRPPLLRCELCFGRGWAEECVPGTEDDYIPETRERYCECEAGRWRRRSDGWTDEEIGEWYAKMLADLEGQVSR